MIAGDRVVGRPARVGVAGWLAMAMVMLAVCGWVPPAHALDDDHWRKARAAIDRGIAYLTATQNEDGSWMPEPGPAVTGLAVMAMLDQPGISRTDPRVEKAVAYILSRVQPDGGIYDRILANYNTSICLSALARINDRPDVAAVIANAQKFLVGLQWNGQKDANGVVVGPEHPFYGGAGYGNHGRPDMSNTHFMLQALYDSGMDCNDPAFQRAVVFVSRCQGSKSNDLYADVIEPSGGFIYATSINKDLIGVPQSMANPEKVDEALAGKPVTGLRAYGSMTYAGFLTYIYADLDRDDPRVRDALRWIQDNYAVDRNPGMPERISKQGLYYYFVTFSKALSAWGRATVETTSGQRVWANDLIDQLVKTQAEDGSWANDADRWMEGHPALVTSYALIALTHAIR